MDLQQRKQRNNYREDIIVRFIRLRSAKCLRGSTEYDIVKNIVELSE